VLDKAIAPDKRSWPPRTLLVLLAALTTGIILSAAVLIKDNWTQLAKEPENSRHLKALQEMFFPKYKLTANRSGSTPPDTHP
jgi:hypothetical protein